MAKATMHFPPDFLWGTTTSSHLPPPQTDLDMASDMGIKAQRLTLAWARIEPEPSHFDTAAIAHYRHLLTEMRAHDIEPMVTLHHFTTPSWFDEKGGFTTNLAVDYFQRYATYVARELGDLVPKWITIEEPMLYLVQNYLQRPSPHQAPPGWRKALEVLPHLLNCHAAAYHAIKEMFPTAQVGTAQKIMWFDPAPHAGWLTQRWAKWVDRFFNDWWLTAVTSGDLRRPLRPTHLTTVAHTADFIGVNYDTRHYVNFPPVGSFYQTKWPAGTAVSDHDYGEIYPAGLFRALKKVNAYQKPIYVTANGLSDGADQHRPAFIITHLREVWRAISFCYPVMGYYHKSLIDFDKELQFGLMAVDEADQTWQLRRSGRLYSEICHTNSLSHSMAEWYAPELSEKLFPGPLPLESAAAKSGTISAAISAN